MNLSRRTFLQIAGATGTTALVSLPSRSSALAGVDAKGADEASVLVDSTLCIGCRGCEGACAEANHLPDPVPDEAAYASMRTTGPNSFTVVNRVERANGEPRYVKRQCMHCVEPACASACPVRAIDKQPNGPVAYFGDRCMGCRYCMVACPFQVPAFEFDRPIHPEIRKCDFCADRQAKGDLPACVNICPVEALTFGPREELVRTAHDRIRRSPERYVDHIYGEYEVGGTSWMYLAGREFSALQLPSVGTSPAPGTSEAIQHGIFAYFVPPVALYALLGGIMWLSKDRKQESE
jgi:formate dehydrogenase iron-sulfur subunit